MGRKILLADDSITIQKVVNLTFSDEGIDVVTVGNGELALRKLNDVRPDIVLADIYMPGKNGYEVCEFVKSHPEFRSIPVILLTAKGQDEDVLSGYESGAAYYMTKPFTAKQLLNGIRLLLGKEAS